MTVDKFRIPLACAVENWERYIIIPGVPFEEIGKLSLEYSEKFRALGIVELLTTGEKDSFADELVHSGMTREAYLQRCKEEGLLEDFHYSSSRLNPLLDAIAAGDFALARRIANLSPKEWRNGCEYEDDYCYAQTLHQLVQECFSEEETQSLLRRFKVCVESCNRVRFDLCCALCERSQSAFDEAFQALLDTWKAQVGRYRKWDPYAFCAFVNELEVRPNNDEERALEELLEDAKKQVFVEGLAILQLAKARGLQTQVEYPYCPLLQYA